MTKSFSLEPSSASPLCWTGTLLYTSPYAPPCTWPNIACRFTTNLGDILPWHAVPGMRMDQSTQRSNNFVSANLLEPPTFTDSPALQHIYFEGREPGSTQTVRQYKVPGLLVTSNWDLIQRQHTPVKVYAIRARMLIARSSSNTVPPALAQRIVVRAPIGKSIPPSHFGPWSTDRAFLTQYPRLNGTPLTQTSTAQLHALQAHRRYIPHKAIHKWETSLSCSIP